VKLLPSASRELQGRTTLVCPCPAAPPLRCGDQVSTRLLHHAALAAITRRADPSKARTPAVPCRAPDDDETAGDTSHDSRRAFGSDGRTRGGAASISICLIARSSRADLSSGLQVQSLRACHGPWERIFLPFHTSGPSAPSPHLRLRVPFQLLCRCALADRSGALSSPCTATSSGEKKEYETEKGPGLGMNVG